MQFDEGRRMLETLLAHGSSGDANDPVVLGDFVSAASWLRTAVPFRPRRYIASRRSGSRQRGPFCLVTQL